MANEADFPPIFYLVKENHVPNSGASGVTKG